jgi:uncharacterized protein (DUF2164 family)
VEWPAALSEVQAEEKWMSDIKLSTDETDRIIGRIKSYFSDELDQELGSFEANFLLEFFAREVGPHFYNRGLADAHTLLTEKFEEIGYLIQELEKTSV